MGATAKRRLPAGTHIYTYTRTCAHTLCAPNSPSPHLDCKGRQRDLCWHFLRVQGCFPMCKRLPSHGREIAIPCARDRCWSFATPRACMLKQASAWLCPFKALGRSLPVASQGWTSHAAQPPFMYLAHVCRRSAKSIGEMRGRPAPPSTLLPDAMRDHLACRAPRRWLVQHVVIRTARHQQHACCGRAAWLAGEQSRVRRRGAVPHLAWPLSFVYHTLVQVVSLSFSPLHVGKVLCTRGRGRSPVTSFILSAIVSVG